MTKQKTSWIASIAACSVIFLPSMCRIPVEAIVIEAEPAIVAEPEAKSEISLSCAVKKDLGETVATIKKRFKVEKVGDLFTVRIGGRVEVWADNLAQLELDIASYLAVKLDEATSGMTTPGTTAVRAVSICETTDPSRTPTDPSRTPTDASRTPTDASRTPTDASRTPTDFNFI